MKAPNLIKGVNLEGVRVVGDPNVQARKYYAGGIDEIIYIDAVATLYARNSLSDLVRATANDVFIPMTVLEELDNGKKGTSEVARNARQVSRFINELIETNGADKIAEGKLKDFYATNCLLEQAFVKDPKITVGQLIQEKVAVIKENILVRRFARFRVGDATPGSPTE